MPCRPFYSNMFPDLFADFSAPLVLPGCSSAPGTTPTESVSEEHLATIVSMGFSREQATKALRATVCKLRQYAIQGPMRSLFYGVINGLRSADDTHVTRLYQSSSKQLYQYVFKLLYSLCTSFCPMAVHLMNSALLNRFKSWSTVNMTVSDVIFPPGNPVLFCKCLKFVYSNWMKPWMSIITHSHCLLPHMYVCVQSNVLERAVDWIFSHLDDLESMEVSEGGRSAGDSEASREPPPGPRVRDGQGSESHN